MLGGIGADRSGTRAVNGRRLMNEWSFIIQVFGRSRNLILFQPAYFGSQIIMMSLIRFLSTEVSLNCLSSLTVKPGTNST